MNSDNHISKLPIKADLKNFFVLSLVITFVMTGASAASLLFRSSVYPSDGILQAFLPNDVVNLVIGVPILLISMWFAKKGRIVGLLLWPGAIFYVLYNYLAYIFALPFNLMFLPNLILVTLSTYTLIGFVANIDGTEVKQRLSGLVPEKLSGGIILSFGLIYLIRVCVIAIGANIDGSEITATELAPMISDFILCPAWIIGGVLLWRKQALGYVSGLGLLFQASMLFIGLIIYMLIQPSLTGVSTSVNDVIVVLIMGMICFIPFGLFVRGIVRSFNS